MFLAAFAALFLLLGNTSQAQQPSPVVAIHDSELTRALDSAKYPAVAPTPTGPGTTGYQWWPTNWHYFVLPETVREAFRSDGTAFTTVGDSNIVAGELLANGAPRYPIVISLSAEAISDSEIAQFTNYVASGGFLLVGASAFTRRPDGTPRGDFAFANELGLRVASPGLTNWGANKTFGKTIEHRLTSHIPAGQLSWVMPPSADQISWGVSPNHLYGQSHFIWRVQPNGATVIAQADNGSPYLAVTRYGKGWFIFHAGMQPLIGHGGWAPGMYAYVIFRKAVEWAFDTQKLPIPKTSPWPFAYDAAFMVRHDLENYTNLIARIEQSARFEYTNGARGDYYFCSGTLREDAASAFDTNTIIASLRRAVANYGATIGSHNGGLRNPRNPALVRGQYDYWHWGPDEALDVTPTNYPNGQAYALTSISNSFLDIEGWLDGLTNGTRSWVSCYFNATREQSYDLQEQLDVKICGEQKISPFPSWVLSTAVAGKRYPMLSQPVSDWFIGPNIAQALEPWRPPYVYTIGTLHQAIDFYYDLGALINIYSHTLSTGEGDAGQLVPEYIRYSLNKTLHPRVWSTNALGVYHWWLERSKMRVNTSYSLVGTRSSIRFEISDASSPGAAVEMLIPGNALPAEVEVLTNGAMAPSNAYRVSGRLVKILVGTTVTNAEIRYLLAPAAADDAFAALAGRTLNIAPPGVLANDTPGMGSMLTAALTSGPTNGTLRLEPTGGFSYTPKPVFTGTDAFSYTVSDGVTNSAPATAVIRVSENDVLFSDDFSRPTDPGVLAPWTARYGTWSVMAGSLVGGTNPSSSYGYAVVGDSWTNFTVQGAVRIPAGGYGAGIGGRLNPVSGAHYAAWIYPESSPGGSNVLRLLKFQSWNTYGYTNGAFKPMQEVPLASVGTNLHTLKLAFSGSQIAVYLDGLLRITTRDLEPQPLYEGGVCAVFWTAATPYSVQFDDLVVSPLTVKDRYRAREHTLLAAQAPGILANDTGVFGTNLVASLMAAPTNGTLTLDANGGFSYQPWAGYAGPDTFVYDALDDGTNLGPAEVLIDVAYVNTAPALPVQADRTIDELAPLTVTNTATDEETPPDALTYQLASAPDGCVIHGQGIITWTPSERQGPGTYTVITTVTDDSQPPLSTTNSFTVTVNEVNQRPFFLLTPGDQFVLELGTLVVTNAASDADIPPNPLGYALVDAPTGAQIDANGVITWTPTASQVASTNTFTTVVRDTNSSALSNQNLMVTNQFKVVVNPRPVIALDSAALVLETCMPNNGVIDPGEAVTVTFAIRNTGPGDLPAISAALLETNGIVSPSASQTVGPLLVGGPALQVPFSFTAAGECGGTITPTLNLSAGSAHLRTVAASFPLGRTASALDQSFDSPLVPALPPDWTTAASGAQLPWFTRTTTNHTPPNAAFCTNGAGVGVSDLRSPAFRPAAGQLRLSFRNYYDLEAGTGSVAFDGGVLEIKIGTNEFKDILDAGGAFLANGYNRTIDTKYGNPLGGRQAWSGRSPGFLTTTVALPVSAADELVTLRWRCGTDDGNNATGWYIDSVTVSGLSCCDNQPPTLAAQANRTIPEQALLQLTNAAISVGKPVHPVEYFLLGAPPGANISEQGVISWTPTEAQGPGTYILTTVARNSAVPGLAATNSFQVTVEEVNRPPSLPAQQDLTIAALTTLTVTNAATDPDLPANNLSYNLVSPPAGAAVDPEGVITWTPGASQAGSYSLITVVSDSGIPQLTATNSFRVVVSGVENAPRILSIQLIPDQAVITWSSVPGVSYKVQANGNLGGSGWLDLPPVYTAQTATVSATNAITGTRQFYRIVRLP